MDHELWRRAVDDIERELLSAATFPETVRGARSQWPQFVLLEPSRTALRAASEDVAAGLADVLARLGITPMRISHRTIDDSGTGGFDHSVDALSAMTPAAFAAAFKALRERIGRVLSASREPTRCHVVVPEFDLALLVATVERLSRLDAPTRPFVHLLTRWDVHDLPNRHRFGDLATIGRAIDVLNAERSSLFLYAWGQPLARHRSAAFGQPVRSVEPLPPLALAEPGEATGDRLTVGAFGAATQADGFTRLPAIVRAAQAAGGSRRADRFVIQAPHCDASGNAAVRAARAELVSLADHGVCVLDDTLSAPRYRAAIGAVDVVLLPAEGRPEAASVSVLALHATAAGKVLITGEGARLSGTSGSRALTARTEHEIGERIAVLAANLDAVRTSGGLAKAAYWSQLRAARVVATLISGPLVLDPDGAG